MLRRVPVRWIRGYGKGDVAHAWRIDRIDLPRPRQDECGSNSTTIDLASLRAHDGDGLPHVALDLMSRGTLLYHTGDGSPRHRSQLCEPCPAPSHRENLTPALCQRLKARDVAGLPRRGGAPWLDVEGKQCVGVDLRWGFEVAFRVSIPLPTGLHSIPVRPRFEAFAEAFGLSAAGLWSAVQHGSRYIRITGIDPRRPKYPISTIRVRTDWGSSSQRTGGALAPSLECGMSHVGIEGRLVASIFGRTK